MTDVTRFIDENFWTIWLACVAWVVAWAIISAVWRRRLGKPIFVTIPPDAAFRETWRSGRSHHSPLTAIGGASRCLAIWVTAGELRVCPHFPFSLLFLPKIYRLEHRIPLASVVDVRPAGGFLAGRSVQVTFRNGDGEEERLSLEIRDVAGFVEATRASDPDATTI